MLKVHYLNHSFSNGFSALFAGRIIQFIADGLIGLFLPIFLLIKFNLDVKNVFIYYLVGQFLYFILLPIGAQFLNKIGLRRSLRTSVYFTAAFYICLFLIDKNLIVFTILSVIVLTIHRILFWVPYHTDFAKFSNKGDRGKEVSLVWGIKSGLSVIMPVLAGILIGKFGFNFVFAITIVLFLSVAIPFRKLPHTKEKYSWSVAETFKNFFAKKNRRLVLANIANGAENRVGLVIWPVFIWKLLDGNFLEVGLLSSLIVFVSIILQLVVGKYTDLFDKRKILHLGTFLYALGWLAKIFILTSGQIFVVGAYHSLVKILKDTPFETLNYEIMADHGHYVDEYTVLKEMSINIGGALMLVFALIVLVGFGLNWTFVLAAVASLFINLL